MSGQVRVTRGQVTEIEIDCGGDVCHGEGQGHLLNLRRREDKVEIWTLSVTLGDRTLTIPVRQGALVKALEEIQTFTKTAYYTA